MKKYIISIFLFCVIVAAVSSAVCFIPKNNSKQSQSTAESASLSHTESNELETEKTENSDIICESFLVYDISSECVSNVSARDYVIGAVAAEMPVTFEEEALKAQAVAAYTYAVRQKSITTDEERKSLHGADFSNDSSIYQAFYNEEQMKNAFGEKYEEYYSKISKLVNEVYGFYISYKNEPIIAAFHSISNGKTESAENVWGGDIPYLVSVESSADKSAPDYSTELTFTKEQVQNIIFSLCNNKNLSESPEKWIEISEKSSSGTVLSVKINDKEFTGEEIREAFELRSSTFEINYNSEKEEFCFTVSGYGHGVGMSQYGAENMAESGSSWEEILQYYYPDTEIIK